MYNKLKKQIQMYWDKKIIFVTHMVTQEGFIVPTLNNQWDYFNGFLGSGLFQKLFDTNVEYVIMGHVHYRKNLKMNNTKYLCRCLNYRTQWDKGETRMNIEDAPEVIYI